MNIAFAYNVKHTVNYNLEDKQEDLEFDSEYVIEQISQALVKLGHTVIKIEADLDAYQKLREKKDQIDLVFNIAEGLGGDARESQIPIFCEMLKIPYTHSSPTTHAVKLNKQLTKDLLHYHGIKVPAALVATNQTDLDSVKLNFPLIVKPNRQGSSKGIFNDSVVNNVAELKKATARVLEQFDTEALIEEYIDGREFTVAVLGSPLRVLPIIEQKFDFLPYGFNKVAGYELKWIYEDSLKNLEDAYECPPSLPEAISTEIQKTSLKICNVLDVKDCARIDYRLNNQNKLFFIEINTLPGINPDTTAISYFPLAAQKSGLGYIDLIDEIIRSAKKRYNI